MATSATAKVVDIVTFEASSSPRETGIGPSSPRITPTTSSHAAAGMPTRNVGTSRPRRARVAMTRPTPPTPATKRLRGEGTESTLRALDPEVPVFRPTCSRGSASRRGPDRWRTRHHHHHFEPAPSTDTRAIRRRHPCCPPRDGGHCVLPHCSSPKNHRSDGIGLLRAMRAQQRVITQPVEEFPKHHPFGLSRRSPAKCGRAPAIIGTGHSQSGRSGLTPRPRPAGADVPLVATAGMPRRGDSDCCAVLVRPTCSPGSGPAASADMPISTTWSRRRAPTPGR